MNWSSRDRFIRGLRFALDHKSDGLKSSTRLHPVDEQDAVGQSSKALTDLPPKGEILKTAQPSSIVGGKCNCSASSHLIERKKSSSLAWGLLAKEAKFRALKKEFDDYRELLPTHEEYLEFNLKMKQSQTLLENQVRRNADLEKSVAELSAQLRQTIRDLEESGSRASTDKIRMDEKYSRIVGKYDALVKTNAELATEVEFLKGQVDTFTKYPMIPVGTADKEKMKAVKAARSDSYKDIGVIREEMINFLDKFDFNKRSQIEGVLLAIKNAHTTGQWEFLDGYSAVPIQYWVDGSLANVSQKKLKEYNKLFHVRGPRGQVPQKSK
jgi:hypothetical protein